MEFSFFGGCGEFWVCLSPRLCLRHCEATKQYINFKGCLSLWILLRTRNCKPKPRFYFVQSRNDGKKFHINFKCKFYRSLRPCSPSNDGGGGNDRAERIYRINFYNDNTKGFTANLTRQISIITA